MSKEQETVKQIFTGCAQVREEKDSSINKMGQCIDRSIISEEEGGFRVTDFGEEMLEKAEKSEKVIKTDGSVIRIES